MRGWKKKPLPTGVSGISLCVRIVGCVLLWAFVVSALKGVRLESSINIQKAIAILKMILLVSYQTPSTLQELSCRVGAIKTATVSIYLRVHVTFSVKSILPVGSSDTAVPDVVTIALP